MHHRIDHPISTMSKVSRTAFPARSVGRPLRWISPIARSRLRPIRCRSYDPKDTEGMADDDAEQRIAKLEAAARGSSAPRRRFFSEEAPEIEPPLTRRRWKDGEALPEDWDNLTASEKIYELYVGDKGLLYWVNRTAFASIFAIGVTWILFRFVGPLLGLYELKSNFSP